MDKTAIEKAMNDRGRGERARVLFDMLMQTLECNMEVTMQGVFERLRRVLEEEQEAIRFLLPTQRMPKAGESPHDYVESFKVESDSVSLSD